MEFENIVIARKLSVLEYDPQMQAQGERIIKSHERQMQSAEKVLSAMEDHRINLRYEIGDDISKDLLEKANLVITLGGDNYFQHISHFLKDQSILGINSDPEGSTGALTYFTPDSFIDFLPKLKNGEFDIEEWTRLQAGLNDQKIPALAVSEIYYGAYKSTDMSRYILEYTNVKNETFSQEQKSSGIIIATGAGTTGWYGSTTKSQNRDEPLSCTKEARLGQFIVREPFSGFLIREEHLFTGKPLSITWLAHGKGLLSIDARVEHELKRGDEVKIEISDIPLKVIAPKRDDQLLW